MKRRRRTLELEGEERENNEVEVGEELLRGAKGQKVTVKTTLKHSYK